MARVDEFGDLSPRAQEVLAHAMNNRMIYYRLDVQTATALSLERASELFDGSDWLDMPGEPYLVNRVKIQMGMIVIDRGWVA